MKKVLTVGVSALFMTEESMRTLVSEMKLPKELIGGVLASANKTKNEFLQSLSSEIIARVGDKIDPVALLQELMARNEIEFTVKVRVRPKQGSETSSG